MAGVAAAAAAERLLDEELAKNTDYRAEGLLENSAACVQCRRLIVGTSLCCTKCKAVWCSPDCRKLGIIFAHDADNCDWRRRLMDGLLSRQELVDYRKQYGAVLPPPPVPHYTIKGVPIIAPSRDAAAEANNVPIKNVKPGVDETLFYTHPSQRYASFFFPRLGFMAANHVCGNILRLYATEVDRSTGYIIGRKM